MYNIQFDSLHTRTDSVYSVFPMHVPSAKISAIEFHLPERTLTTQQLSELFPEWSVEKIDAKTGIHVRHLAAEGECASDLACKAAQKIFSSGACSPENIDFLILCTQCPDYLVPTTACLLQDRLGIPTSTGALDVNLGCSAFVYGLGLAHGLITSSQASSVLLLTGDAYSRFIRPDDKVTRTIFGDAGTATLILAGDEFTTSIGPFVYGTNGKGGPQVMLKNSGTRGGYVVSSLEAMESGYKRENDHYLFMNGPNVFHFALAEVPATVEKLLNKAHLQKDDVDLFVFHQANKYILDELRKIIGIPENKFHLAMSHCGNTSSSSIPIALKYAENEGRLFAGAVVMLLGFGAGLSWSGTLVRWTGLK